MRIPSLGGITTELFVMDSCRWRGDDETSMRFRVPELLINIAHLQKVNV
jgi:hypothetical protein